MTKKVEHPARSANFGKSTGPKTPGGKFRSSHNALKNGIYSVARLLPGEDREAYQRLEKDFFDTFHPMNPIEAYFSHAIVDTIWRDQRLTKAAYAALKQNEVELQLADEMRAAGTVCVSSDVAKSLREVLAREEREEALGTAEIEQAVNAGTLIAERLSAVGHTNVPPLSLTFLLAFGAGPSSQSSAEIDRHRTLARRELARLYKALREIQDLRMTQTVIAVEEG